MGRAAVKIDLGSLAAGARIDGVDGGMHGSAGVAEQG
jgi:hypothetical protein